MATKTKMEAAGGGYDFGTVRANRAKQEEGVTFPLLDRDGKQRLYNGEPVTLTVRGSHSKTFREMVVEFERTYYAEATSIEDPVERDAAFEAAVKEKARAFDMRVRAPNIIGWYGFVQDGEPVDLTIEFAQELMDTPDAAAQVRAAQERPERFFAEASTD